MGYIFQIVRDIDPKLRLLIDTFTLLGLAWSTRFAFRFLSAIYYGLRVHVLSRFGRTDLVKRYGRWAVITGATDGVGLEYARQFAARGLSIVLVGRNEHKLGRVQEELLGKHRDRIQVQTIVADLNNDDAAMYARIQGELLADGKEIGILVNNAGVMYDSPNRFLEQPEGKIFEHIRVNMLAVAMMTRVVLPSMVARRKGLVINMSSIAAYQPLPLMGIYSASKVCAHRCDLSCRAYSTLLCLGFRGQLFAQPVHRVWTVQHRGADTHAELHLHQDDQLLGTAASQVDQFPLR